VTTADHRERDRIALDLIGLAGIAATAAGLAFLAPSKDIGFHLGPAFEGVAGQLATTLPAAALVTLVSLIELAAGLAIARFARRAPFASIADALLAAAVVTVLKDLAELSVLGQLGLFKAPILALIDLVLLAGAWQLRARTGPILDQGDADAWRPSIVALGSIPLAVLVAVIWAGPIFLQLASPVVPFIDVLPNHVAPVEHLRTFGAFTPLTATQSPIYGSSRSLLGYIAVVGAVTTLSGIPGTLATAAFVLPSTFLIGVAAYRLVVVAAGEAGGRTTGAFALLAFALTGSFARLADDRATVVVLPLAAFAVAFAIERTRAGHARRAGDRAGEWRLPDGVILGLAIGASVLVHPVIGALTAATVGLVGLVQPRRAGTLAVTGGVTAAIVAAPQATTMVGLALPSIVLIVAIPAGILVGLAVDRVRAGHVPLLLAGRIAVVALLAVGLVLAGPDPGALLGAPGPFLLATALLLLAWVAGLLARVPAARDPVLLAALGVGYAAAILTQAVPGNGLLTQGLKFELPKTLYYWIPVIAAVPAGATLDWLWRPAQRDRVGAIALTAAWLVVAAVPLRVTPIDQFHLGEHRFSEALAIDLREAGTGFWVGYPDSRLIVDAPRQQILDAVSAEIAAGRIGPDTPILHVAGSFQQWVATPLGVFLGVTESDVSPDAEASIHTVGGRLLHVESLSTLLDGPTYPYLLLEPSDQLPANITDEIAAAGYQSIFSNGQGTLYRLGGS
jgi:hypothetical protein